MALKDRSLDVVFEEVCIEKRGEGPRTEFWDIFSISEVRVRRRTSKVGEKSGQRAVSWKSSEEIILRRRIGCAEGLD